jgi:phosphoribosylcarboxyaminoimidazole (NCAIR) mutase
MWRFLGREVAIACDHQQDVKVIIADDGGAAHLLGKIALLTPLPVIRVTN